MIYFTSDTHFYHKNIIKYCNRPYASVDEMNTSLIRRWNQIIKPDIDEVFFLGDFAFAYADQAAAILDKLHGKKYLIKGNHDRRLLQSGEFCKRFETIDDTKTIKVDETSIVLFHYPMEEWDGFYHGAWHFHGHRHSAQPFSNIDRRVDVGVDAWDYTPISFNEIKEAAIQRG